MPTERRAFAFPRSTSMTRGRMARAGLPGVPHPVAAAASSWGAEVRVLPVLGGTIRALGSPKSSNVARTSESEAVLFARMSASPRGRSSRSATGPVEGRRVPGAGHRVRGPVARGAPTSVPGRIDPGGCRCMGCGATDKHGENERLRTHRLQDRTPSPDVTSADGELDVAERQVRPAKRMARRAHSTVCRKGLGMPRKGARR
jgi:hypothetical protein